MDANDRVLCEDAVQKHLLSKLELYCQHCDETIGSLSQQDLDSHLALDNFVRTKVLLKILSETHCGLLHMKEGDDEDPFG